MNASEVITRLTNLEQKVEKLTPAIDYGGLALGTAIPGIGSALGIQLIGLTTTQRTALGIKLATLSEVKHILVFDTDDKTFYAWDGTQWT